jgi:rhodanese-related sulfurtransferase
MLRRSALMLMMGFAALAAGGCKSQHASVKELTIPDSAAAHKAGAVFVDANGEDYRKSNGKVPGAILLSNYRQYDAKAVLPQSTDTPLVFYCSSRL